MATLSLAGGSLGVGYAVTPPVSSESPDSSASSSAVSVEGSASSSPSQSVVASPSPSAPPASPSAWTPDAVATVTWALVFMCGLLAMLAVGAFGRH